MTEQPVGLVRSHLGLFLSVLAGAVVFVRLLTVSAFDYETAVAVLSLQGTSMVVFGSLLALAYLLPFAGMQASSFLGEVHKAKTGSAGSYRVAYFVLTAVTVFVAPLGLAVIGAAMFLVLEGQAWRVRRSQKRFAEELAGPPSPLPPPTLDDSPEPGAGLRVGVPSTSESAPSPTGEFVRSIGALMLWTFGAAGVVALGAAPPWLPLERIDERGSTLTIVGYVLDASDTEVVVLRNSPREVVRLTNEDGFNRSYCTADTWLTDFGTSLLQREVGSAGYPECPLPFSGR